MAQQNGLASRARLLPQYVIFVTILSSGASFADEALDDGLSRLAKGVVTFIQREQGANRVLVGDFSAPPRLKAAGGSGLRKQIESALEKEGVTIADDAPFQLMGMFRNVDRKVDSQDSFESVAMRITVNVLDVEGVQLGQLNISVFGESAVQFLGGHGDLPVDATAAEREQAKRESIKDGSAVVAGQETRTQAGLFGVEVRVREGISDKSEPRTPELNNGRSFVSLSRGEEYIVRLHNHSSFEAAVTLTIDGLNMFAFSDADNLGNQVLVSPGKSVDIPGWHVTNERSDAFEVTHYAEGAAATLVPISETGTITASFHAAWEPTADPPEDEVNAKGADTATGRGRKIDQKYEEVQRVVGRLRAAVSVRYNR